MHFFFELKCVRLKCDKSVIITAITKCGDELGIRGIPKWLLVKICEVLSSKRSECHRLEVKRVAPLHKRLPLILVERP